MRRTALAPLLALAALACGGGDAGPGEAADVDTTPGAEAGPVAEDPGLPTGATGFRPTPGSAAGAGEGAGIGGHLRVSGASTGDADGVSLIAQLRNLPASRSYSWAIHRGGCTAPDDLLFGLGWGAVADAEGQGEAVANGGGPLGEMRLTFTPEPDGRAEETVFVPFDGGFTRAALDAGRHSLRIHTDVEGEDPGRSVACAPVPSAPRSGEGDPEGPAAGGS